VGVARTVKKVVAGQQGVDRQAVEGVEGAIPEGQRLKLGLGQRFPQLFAPADPIQDQGGFMLFPRRQAVLELIEITQAQGQAADRIQTRVAGIGHIAIMTYLKDEAFDIHAYLPGVVQ